MDFFSSHQLDEFEMVLITPEITLDFPEIDEQPERSLNLLDTVDVVTTYEEYVLPDMYPHKCPKCGTPYQRKGWLRSHMARCRVRPNKLEPPEKETRPHGKKPCKSFVCGTCGNKFGYKHTLVRHKRIHTGERPYPCQHCPRAFSDSGDCLKHIRRHLKYIKQREQNHVIQHNPQPPPPSPSV